MSIRRLSEATASRIAAGEVIERPASVVKELVENSLDAGATRIDIEVRDGGMRLISITDNGTGIRPDEIALAFERFATSKIADDSELTAIRTLGFRGEALPSVASVAHVEAVSRVPVRDNGVRIVLNYGRVVTQEPAAAPPGTTVRVSDIFRNVPARLKFLSSPGTELARIQHLASILALVYPHVAFRLASDGAVRLTSPGGGDRLAAIAAVYGSKAAQAMLAVEGDSAAAFSVSGLVGSPELARGNRTYITLSVNGRWVQSRRLQFAVEQAYLGFLPERRYPVAVLDVRAPFEDIDVNVHPAKAEVRFLREDIVFAEIQRAIRRTLTEGAHVRPLRAPSANPGIGGRAHHQDDGAARRSATTNAVPGDPAMTPEQRLFATEATWPIRGQPVLSPASGPTQQTPTTGPAVHPASEIGHPLSSQTGGAPAGKPIPQRQVLPVLRVVGQAQETYILCEGPDGVYLIDQHAAHERVLYEDIKRRSAARSVESQPLLEPEAFDLGPAHASFIESHLETLSTLGFVVEPFGPKTALVRAIPKLLVDRGHGRGIAGEWLLRLIDESAERGRTDSWQDRLLYTMACHASVRAGQKLTNDECRELIRQLEQVEQPHTCPHGRPTMLHLNSGHLEREFGRR